MFNKSRRYLTIFRVFLKYNLFSLVYKDIHKNYISNMKCTCSLDMENRMNAEKLRSAFEELGPSFIKLGQMISKRPDLVPHTYVMELEKLQDKVQPLEFERMRESFENECECSATVNKNTISGVNYGSQDILDIFDEFETEPIASASIGQVYRGVLNGQKVAVKISRPKLIDNINLDLAIIDDLKPIIVKVMGLGSNFDINAFLREFRELLTNELDYRIEARNMMRFYENLKNYENVIVPRVYRNYSKENILVMDFIEGKMVKDLGDADLEERKNYAKQIAAIYLKQVYIDGFYHGDPHGGNIVVKDGKIAFIDFGAMGKLDSELKRDMLNLFYGIYIQNVDLATDAFLKIGKTRKEDIDLGRFNRDMDTLIAEQKYGTGERQSDNYAKLALKYNLSLPSEFSTLERALVLIESVCLDLDPDFNLLDVARPITSQAITDRYSLKKAAEGIQLEGDRYLEILKNYPSDVTDIIETIRGFGYERRESKSDVMRMYSIMGEFSKNVFISVVIIASTYFILRGDGYLPSLGIFGFMGGILLGTRSFRNR
ncbi:MAG: AarF/ABC1/UbiB kinase family protein [Methanosarcinaceae archaeon]|nr:AarF/ABC1/UbiB kinase family protein [Methanosarcinaceae archaeon]